MREQLIGFRYLTDGPPSPVYGGASPSLEPGGQDDSWDGGLLIPEDAPDLAIIVECPGDDERPA